MTSSDPTTVPGGEGGERADPRPGADRRRRPDGVLDRRPLPHLAVDEPGVRADLAALADDGRSVQHRPRVQRDVAPEVDGDVDERLARVEHRHAVEQPVPVGPRPQLALGEGELPAVVDALRLVGRGRDAVHSMAHRRQRADDVGEVVLALGVVGRQVAQRRAEEVAAEGVDARADLADLPLLAAGVALLDDAQHPVVGTADDPAVAGRVVQHRRQHGDGVVVGDVGGDELVERLGPQQRRVAGEHDDRRLVVEVVARDGRHPARRRVAGAALLELLDERDVRPRRGELGDLRGDLLGVMADDDRGRRRPQPLQGLDDVEDHRPAADHVQRLGAVGAHPRALAGGEHDGRNAHSTGLPRRDAVSRQCIAFPGRSRS